LFKFFIDIMMSFNNVNVMMMLGARCPALTQVTTCS